MTKRVEEVDLKDLSSHGRFTCENCGYTWEGPRPRRGERCPKCDQAWWKAERITWLPDGLQSSSGCAVLIVGSALLLGCCWLYFEAGPKIQEGWSRFTQGVVSWLGFFGSIGLSVISLSGATLLLFALFFIFVVLLLLIVSRFSRYNDAAPIWQPARNTLEDHGRLIGTLINLVASLCALWIVSWVSNRQPDYWDFGIQFLIAVGIEVAIYRFWDDLVGWTDTILR